LGQQDIGFIGELHPRWVQQIDLAHAPVVFEIDVAAISAVPLPAAGDLSRQPVVIRDLAVWVHSDVSYQELLDTLTHAIATDATLAVVKDIRLFDIWRDKSAEGATAEKSMALRFWLQDFEATLDETKVEHCMNRLLHALTSAHGARQRA
jgi:phenylalanyl-tRNA synthetase beta chain